MNSIHYKKRDCVTYQTGDAQVTIFKQLNGKLDNAIIDFGSAQFDGSVLFNVFQQDQFNCYPYVIFCPDGEVEKAKTAAKQFGIEDRVFVNPNHTDLMYACSVAKGASKGFNASKSHNLDRILLNWVENFLTKIDSELSVICPREQGSENEDIRVLKFSTQFRSILSPLS